MVVVTGIQIVELINVVLVSVVCLVLHMVGSNFNNNLIAAKQK